MTYAHIHGFSAKSLGKATRDMPPARTRVRRSKPGFWPPLSVSPEGVTLAADCFNNSLVTPLYLICHLYFFDIGVSVIFATQIFPRNLHK
ncbi:hypothetical protein [Microseira wollei]|uniref:Uncharacterized protein n=1 Tax=Microseira wollei NIES-4236 TaxID=2530354 RepID=A0AAV3WID9_9CYAN|nr:hypothetical protein [Microseira wollei]GET39189.1 hypothetical protein MiSe_39530 [Microseira wollei NIES-4236]